MKAMLDLLCCQPRQTRPRSAASVSAGVQHTTGGQENAGVTSALCRNDQRILQCASVCNRELGFERSPSRSLLEASTRRLAHKTVNPSSEASDDDQIALNFVHSYMNALKNADICWANSNNVSGLLDESILLFTPDRQSFRGKTAVLARLNQGVEALTKLAGKDAGLPEFDLNLKTNMFDAKPKAAPVEFVKEQLQDPMSNAAIAAVS